MVQKLRTEKIGVKHQKIRKIVKQRVSKSLMEEIDG